MLAFECRHVSVVRGVRLIVRQNVTASLGPSDVEDLLATNDESGTESALDFDCFVQQYRY